jgi:tripartite-type tricarboxylate transporter receptor subunit TctC
MLLKGKTALVAGAGRNNGKAIALAFAHAGADLILIARERDEDLQKVPRECLSIGVRTLPVLADVNSPHEVERVVRLGLERFEKIDILTPMSENIRASTTWMGVFSMLCACSSHAQDNATGSGQAYPAKPVRFITQAPGGGSDFAVRIITQGIAGTLGLTIVENRPSVIIAAETVAKAPPDGYTLIYVGGGFWVTPMLQKTTYDVARDFTPVTLATSSSTILVVHPSLPVKSVKDLIALAKAQPGELNYASAGTGGSGHLSGEMLKAMAGINIVHVPYKGGGAALNDLLSGQIQLTLDGGSALKPHIQAGKLRPLAVTSARPSALTPELPTIAAAGLPGYEMAQLNVIFAPAKTPAPIIQRLNQDIVRFLKLPETKERFFNAGVEVAGSTPEELGAIMKSDVAKIGKVIRDAGIRSE